MGMRNQHITGWYHLLGANVGIDSYMHGVIKHYNMFTQFFWIWCVSDEVSWVMGVPPSHPCLVGFSLIINHPTIGPSPIFYGNSHLFCDETWYVFSHLKVADSWGPIWWQANGAGHQDLQPWHQQNRVNMGFDPPSTFLGLRVARTFACTIWTQI